MGKITATAISNLKNNSVVAVNSCRAILLAMNDPPQKAVVSTICRYVLYSDFTVDKTTDNVYDFYLILSA